MVAVLGRGMYTFAEASCLISLKQTRVREWFRGHSGRTKAVFAGDYEPVDGEYALSFLDLIDVLVAGQLREHGVSLQTLRRVYHRMQTDLQTPHPFCREELLSDGKVVFIRGLDAEGQVELAEALTRQKVFPQILLPFLKRIDYGVTSKLAERWRIGEQVVIDPTICFGKPVVEKTGVPTRILAAAYFANGNDADLVADWYNVHTDHVLVAVRFETNMAA